MTNPEGEGLVERLSNAPLRVDGFTESPRDMVRLPYDDVKAAVRLLTHPLPDGEGGEREKVIEECAKVADAAMLVGDGCADPRTWDNGYNNACHNIAKRIRSLTTSEPRT